jgi:alpha-galactosidase
VEGSDLWLPQRETGVMLCLYGDYNFDFFSEDIKEYITEQSSIMVKVILLDDDE